MKKGNDASSFFIHTYLNLSSEPIQTGLLSFPFGEEYFPRIDHASYHVALQLKAYRHSHPVYHILICTGGTGTFVVDSHDIPAEKGLLLLVSPNVPHFFNNTPNQSKEFCVITFEWLDRKGRHLTLPFEKMLSQWSGHPCRAPIHCLPPTDMSAGLVLEIEQLVNAGLRNDSFSGLETVQHLWQVLYELVKHFSSCPLPAESETPLLRVRHYIQNHYRESISLPALARVACLTPNYLSSVFKKTFGVSPVAYQNSLRIRAACSLLASSEYAVKEIAANTGFEDIYYFSKVFKKIIGSTPAAYRKKAFSSHASASSAADILSDDKL